MHHCSGKLPWLDFDQQRLELSENGASQHSLALCYSLSSQQSMICHQGSSVHNEHANSRKHQQSHPRYMYLSTYLPKFSQNWHAVAFGTIFMRPRTPWFLAVNVIIKAKRWTKWEFFISLAEESILNYLAACASIDECLAALIARSSSQNSTRSSWVGSYRSRSSRRSCLMRSQWYIPWQTCCA